MKILFICKYNRFRSKCSEALFNKYNKDSTNEVKSAGIMLDFMNQFVAGNVISELKKRGAKVANEKSQMVDEHLIKWADKIIISADNVSIGLFPKEKTEQWMVRDASEHDIIGTRESVDNIENRIKDFVKRIKSKT